MGWEGSSILLVLVVVLLVTEHWRAQPGPGTRHCKQRDLTEAKLEFAWLVVCMACPCTLEGGKEGVPGYPGIIYSAALLRRNVHHPFFMCIPMGYDFWHTPLAANAAVTPILTRGAGATIAYWAE
eukprot:372778-Rhodomonas_salina.1